MADYLTEHFQTFQEAALKTLEENPTLLPPTASNFDDFAEVVGTFLADGNCGWVVFIAGREFAAKLLENIVHAKDYDVCIALREAIKGGATLFDSEGERGVSFVTPTYKAWMAEALSPDLSIS